MRNPPLKHGAFFSDSAGEVYTEKSWLVLVVRLVQCKQIQKGGHPRHFLRRDPRAGSRGPSSVIKLSADFKAPVRRQGDFVQTNPNGRKKFSSMPNSELLPLNSLFTSLNSPGQLKGWQMNGSSKWSCSSTEAGTGVCFARLVFQLRPQNRSANRCGSSLLFVREFKFVQHRIRFLYQHKVQLSV